MSGMILGTPNYMAPEQTLGTSSIAGPAADIYSLGAILYETLVGRPPFRGASLLETLEQVRSLEPVSPRMLQPRVSRDLETICIQCLQKEPTQRYEAATSLADDLARFIAGSHLVAGCSEGDVVRWDVANKANWITRDNYRYLTSPDGRQEFRAFDVKGSLHDRVPAITRSMPIKAVPTTMYSNI